MVLYWYRYNKARLSGPIIGSRVATIKEDFPTIFFVFQIEILIW
jgi:hypothetical protein